MATLIGLFTLGRDAELRNTQNGDQVATLALAYNYGKKGQDGKQPTQWVRASLWVKPNSKLVEYLLRGKQFYMQLDDLHVTTFRKADGTDGVSLEGCVGQIEFVRAGQTNSGEQSGRPAPAPAPRPAPRPAPPSSGFEDMDPDEIPF